MPLLREKFAEVADKPLNEETLAMVSRKVHRAFTTPGAQMLMKNRYFRTYMIGVAAATITDLSEVLGIDPKHLSLYVSQRKRFPPDLEARVRVKTVAKPQPYLAYYLTFTPHYFRSLSRMQNPDIHLAYVISHEMFHMDEAARYPYLFFYQQVRSAKQIWVARREEQRAEMAAFQTLRHSRVSLNFDQDRLHRFVAEKEGRFVRAKKLFSE